MMASPVGPAGDACPPAGERHEPGSIDDEVGGALTPTPDEDSVLSRAIGSWADHGVDSVAHVDRLRSGRRIDDVR